MSISKNSATNISKVLTEALPYIQKFSGKNIVIKYGGSAMQESFLRKNFARDIVLMKTVGINPVIVHGGGPQIGKELDKLKLEFSFKNGIRVTTPEMIKVIQKVLDGFKVYYIYLHFNFLKSLFFLFRLSINSVKRKF